MTRQPVTPPPLSPEALRKLPAGGDAEAAKVDRILDAVVRPRAKVDRLWGRPAIALALGVSEDTVSSWAKIPGVPIYEPLPGRYLAYRSELEPWLRTKQPAGNP